MLRTANILNDENNFLDQLSQEILSQLLDGDQLRAPELRSQPLAIQRRVLQIWLKQLDVGDCGFVEIERIRQLLEDHTIAKVNLPGGKYVRRREKRLFVE